MAQDIINTRKEVFHRFYNSMKEQIEKSIKNNSDEEKEKALDSIEATLHALFDYWERLKDNNLFCSDIKKNIYAFKFVNNVLKHAVKFERGTGFVKGGMYFPITFPL